MTKQIHGEYAKFEIGERVLVKMGALDSHLIERNPWAGSKVALCNMLYGVSSDNFTIVEGEPMPISDTPETDALLDPLRGSAAFNGPTAELARRLERERDAFRDALTAIKERFTNGSDPDEDWDFMGETARKALEAQP